MVIAVLSDIHGNYVALEKCVEYALNKGADTFIFLGDYVGELAYPQKTMNILYFLERKYVCYFIKGNKEEYWINYESNGEKGWNEYDSTTGSLFYTYSNLTVSDLDFFKGLQHKKDVCFNGFSPITICHGSPNKVNEKLLPDNETTFSIMDNDDNSLILCGHTHIQGKIEYNGKSVLNVGSVGVSLHSQGKAQFMLLRGVNNTWSYEFVSLDYDAEKVIAELYTSGLSEKAPYWCKVSQHLLRSGEISHGSVLARVMSLCQQDIGQCKWPEVPEQYWEKAINELIGS